MKRNSLNVLQLMRRFPQLQRMISEMGDELGHTVRKRVRPSKKP